MPSPGTKPSASVSGLSRRGWLKAVVGLATGAAVSGCAPTRHTSRITRGQAAGRSSNLIRQENERKGTHEWLLSQTRIDPASEYRCPWIEGYCSRASVRAGDTLSVLVNTNPTSDFSLEIYRMGYYGGTGGRLVSKLGPFRGQQQSDPAIGGNRLRECQWNTSASFRIPRDWLSGVYLGKLRALADEVESYVIFIVRDQRPADFIFQCSDLTWQAYNRWPDHFALYDNGQENWWCGPGVDVSFDRPYGKYCQILDAPLSTGSGEWFLWEYPLAYWLEAAGYDVTYISNLDTHSGAAGLKRANGFLSVGHDEYYSIEMYQNLRRAIAGGLNVAFLSGNTCCGRIELRPSTTGTPFRTYGRTDYFGPRDEGMVHRFPSMGLFPNASPPESLLLGARSNVPPCTGGADWICSLPDHWIYEGTGMHLGERIPGLIGWEWHGQPAPISGLAVLATGPTQDAPGKPNGGTYTATLYEGPKGNFVFNASTCWWADGLAEPPGYVRPSVYTSPRGPDPRVQRITTNLLQRMCRLS
jgi:hypothetical protein